MISKPILTFASAFFIKIQQEKQISVELSKLMRKAGLKKRADDEDYIIYTETNKRHKITKKYISTGEWTNKENEIYLRFLESHLPMFETEFIRRSTKVFRKMSSLLRRRDSEQCRSHHQKLVLKYGGSIQAIVENLWRKIRANEEGNPRQEIDKQVYENQGRNWHEKMVPAVEVSDLKEKKQEEGIPTGPNAVVDQVREFKVRYLDARSLSIQINLNFIQSW